MSVVTEDWVRSWQGIRGWMILPAIGTCLAPLLFVRDAFPGFEAFSHPLSLDAKVVVAGAMSLSFAQAVGWCVAIYKLFNWRPSYPPLFITLTVVNILSMIGTMFLLKSAFNVDPGPDELRDLVKGIVYAGIWIPYMFMSRRVRATFGWPDPYVTS